MVGSHLSREVSGSGDLDQLGQSSPHLPGKEKSDERDLEHLESMGWGGGADQSCFRELMNEN